MARMKVHNTRSPQQWEIISKYIDFKDKTVLDLGCGYADILFKCREAGATLIQGVDENDHILKTNYGQQLPYEVSFVCMPIETVINKVFSEYDIIICFSVLPYLTNPLAVLKWMKEHSQISLIECQFAGDGPGFTHIKNDNDMLAYLRLAGWKSLEPIGKTLVRGRNKYRTIWMCR